MADLIPQPNVPGKLIQEQASINGSSEAKLDKFSSAVLLKTLSKQEINIGESGLYVVRPTTKLARS